METLIAVILAGAVIAYIGYPLFRSRVDEYEEPVRGETQLDEVASQKESTLAAIAELDFDLAMGNLSQKDYQELRDKYKLKALALLKKEDELVQAEGLAPMEVEEVGEDLPRISHTAAEPQGTRQMKPASTKTGAAKSACGLCGGKVSAGDRFCASCGSPISQGCPNCGADFGPGDAFCANCGQKLAIPVRRR